MSLDNVVNFGKVQVSIGYDAAAVSIVLTGGDGAKLPAPASSGAFNLVWYNSSDYGDPSDDPSREIVRCTARSTDTLTVTRAQEGTSATTKNTASKTYKMLLSLTKKTYDDLVAASVSVEAPTGTVDGNNNSFTVVNTPRFIIVDGLVRFSGLGYTYSSLVITVDPLAPPMEYIRSIY